MGTHQPHRGLPLAPQKPFTQAGPPQTPANSLTYAVSLFVVPPQLGDVVEFIHLTQGFFRSTERGEVIQICKNGRLKLEFPHPLNPGLTTIYKWPEEVEFLYHQ